jgi:hypothetical protein
VIPDFVLKNIAQMQKRKMEKRAKEESIDPTN